jgi:hypothetical protein
MFQYCSLFSVVEDYGQLIVQGSAELKTKEYDPNLINFYWKRMYPNIQKIYLPNSDHINQSAIQPTTLFGIICIKPYLLELLEIHKEYYLKSKRMQFRSIITEK